MVVPRAGDARSGLRLDDDDISPGRTPPIRAALSQAAPLRFGIKHMHQLNDPKQYKCGMLGQPRNVSNSIDFGPSAFSYLAIKPAQ